MIDDELYRKYLESVFVPHKESFYYIPKLNIILPDNEVLNNFTYYDLYHIFVRMNRPSGYKSYVYDIEGNPTYLKYPTNFEIVSALNGYYVLRRALGDDNYYLYDYNDELVFSCTSETKSYNWPPMQLENRNEKLILKDDGNNIVYEISIKDNKKVIKLESVSSEKVHEVLKELNISEDLIEKLKSKNILHEIRYNNSFWEIRARFLDGYELPILAACRLKKQNTIKIIAYNPKGLQVQFNKEKCLVRDKLSDNDKLTYYDNNGKKISEFISIKIKEAKCVDENIYNLFVSGKLKLQLEENKLLGFINDKRYELYGRFTCGRALVRDENGLYGYLDYDGKEVIKPQFTSAGEFCRGTASVYGGTIDVNGNYIEHEMYETIKNNNGDFTFYRGERSINKYILGFSKKDFSCYFETVSPKKGIRKRKKKYYYYIDYKTKEIIKTTYQPVRQYFNFMIFHIHKIFYWQEGYYLFNKKDKSYTWLTNNEDFLKFYDDYFILNGRTYYITDRIVDLGDFSLACRVKKDDRKLFAKDEYLYSRRHTEDAKEAKAKKDELKKQLAMQENQKKKVRLQEIEQEMTALREERESILANMSREEKIRISVPDDFEVEKNGIKRVNSKYIYSLEKYDLMFYDFTGFDVSNLDFSGTNAAINPQTIYNRDMSNGNFCDVNFLSYDFSNVDIRGAIFNNDFVICYQEKILGKKLTK